MKIAAVLLAAGQGTRMKSKLAKVLHPICGQPILFHALQAVSPFSAEEPVVVIGHGANSVRAALGNLARCVVQKEQLGTGHAVLQAEDAIKGKADLVIVTYGDMPLLRADTISKLIETQKENPGPITLLTVIAEDPRGFGRIVRKTDGTVQVIVEEQQATEQQRAIKELNVGAYCFSSEWLWDALKRVKASPKGEYYLTDTIALAVEEGLLVQAMVHEDAQETIGVNTRVHLAEAEAIMRQRINQAHMLNGVSIIDPAATYIDAGVKIGQDTVIWPNCCLQGKTEIGVECLIGPNSIIRNSVIGNRCQVLSSDVESAQLAEDVHVGPFARLRKGARLEEGVHVGNFGEVKDSRLGPGAKMGHFSYIGNAEIGANTNIGAGTITCNFDGQNKHQTTIGEDVFIGSDTLLVAPLTVGDRARTGAGAVVTKNVPEDSLAVGMPARVIRKLKKENNEH